MIFRSSFFWSLIIVTAAFAPVATWATAPAATQAASWAATTAASASSKKPEHIFHLPLCKEAAVLHNIPKTFVL